MPLAEACIQLSSSCSDEDDDDYNNSDEDDDDYNNSDDDSDD